MSRLPFRIASGLLVLLLLIYASDLALEWHHRRAAERLIRQAQQFQVGVTTLDEVNRLLRKVGKHLSADTLTTASGPRTLSAAVDFSSPNLIIGGEGRTLPGRRLWLISVLFVVKDKLLNEVYIRLLIRRSDGVVLSQVVDFSTGHEDPILESRSYFVSRPHITGPPAEGLKVHVGPTANLLQTARAFDINFSCLTGLRECRHVCDVMPDAWQDLLDRYPDTERKQIEGDYRQP